MSQSDHSAQSLGLVTEALQRMLTNQRNEKEVLVNENERYHQYVVIVTEGEDRRPVGGTIIYEMSKFSEDLQESLKKKFGPLKEVYLEPRSNPSKTKPVFKPRF